MIASRSDEFLPELRFCPPAFLSPTMNPRHRVSSKSIFREKLNYQGNPTVRFETGNPRYWINSATRTYISRPVLSFLSEIINCGDRWTVPSCKSLIFRSTNFDWAFQRSVVRAQRDLIQQKWMFSTEAKRSIIISAAIPTVTRERFIKSRIHFSHGFIVATTLHRGVLLHTVGLRPGLRANDNGS